MPTLAGFDFPIGLPVAYGRQTGLAGFSEALKAFGHGRWALVFDVADTEGEIAIERPFYPRRTPKGVTRASLVRGLGVERFDDLLRVCDRKTDGRRAACSTFWTLGGNQVGKGAISGWREIVRPAMERGAALWPFGGKLADLAVSHPVVLAESYPAGAYQSFGVSFLGKSKTRQTDRREKAGAIIGHASAKKISLDPYVEAMVEDGFGASRNGEDAFDAFAGLLLMIEVAEGRRDEAPSRVVDDPFEGWILGA